MAGAGQGQDCFSSSPCSHPDPREPPRWRLSAHSRHVAAGCQDIRRGRSENNRPLMFSFQKEGVAIAGNFCDQQSWLIVSSSVSQALAPSHGAAWPPCAASLSGAQGHPRSWGSPACLVGPQRWVCKWKQSREFWGLDAPLVSAMAPAAPSPSGHPLCGAARGRRACAASRSVLALCRLCCLAGEMLRRGGEHRAGARHQPAPACASLPRQPADRVAALETAGAEGTFQFPLGVCTRFKHMPVAVCWSCLWFWGR